MTVLTVMSAVLVFISGHKTLYDDDDDDDDDEYEWRIKQEVTNGVGTK